MIVVLNKRQRLGPNLPDDELTITLYEAWKVDDGLPSMPLWASNKIKGNYCNDSSTDAPAWVKLWKLPSLSFPELPVEVHTALTESNGELYHKPLRHVIVTNYMGTGMDLITKKPPYTHKVKAGTIRYIMHLDKEEKLSSDRNGI